MNSPAFAFSTLFPADGPSSDMADTWRRGFAVFFQPVDLPALQAPWRTQAAVGGEFAVRLLDAWRQLADTNLRLARRDSDALFHLCHELLACNDPSAANGLVARQVHPAAERLRVWQEHILDTMAGVQSDAVILAESCMPAARTKL